MLQIKQSFFKNEDNSSEDRENPSAQKGTSLPFVDTEINVQESSFDIVAKIKRKRNTISNDTAEHTVLILISVMENEDCCKNSLEAVIKETIHTYKESNIFLVLGDEIQKHNLKAKLGITKITADAQKDLSQAVAKLREDYLKANFSYILSGLNIDPTKFKSKFSELYCDSSIEDDSDFSKRICTLNELCKSDKGRIFRLLCWNDFIEVMQNMDSKFTEKMEAAKRLFNNDSEIQKKLQEEAEIYNKKHAQEQSDYLYQIESSKDFLTEEYTIFSSLNKFTGIYPRLSNGEPFFVKQGRKLLREAGHETNFVWLNCHLKQKGKQLVNATEEAVENTANQEIYSPTLSNAL